MLKNYVLSFLALTFYPFMLAPALVSFALVLLSLLLRDTGISMKPIAAAVAVVLVVALAYYNVQKIRLRRKCGKIENAKEYDDAVMLGFNFLCEERMIAYAKQDIAEYYYTDLLSVEKSEDKKGKPVLQLKYPNASVTVPVGSVEQGERTAAFLLRKNPSVEVIGIKAEGNGNLHSIDRTEKEN